jgi:uncharacterized membrane protein YgcG
MRCVIASSLSILLLGGASSAFANGPGHFPSALPPVANPGECYAQVKVPAQYQTGTQSVVKADGYTKLEVTEPEFQIRREGVMVREPSTRYVVRQPSYRTVSEQILTRPAHERLSVSQPQFSTVTETLQTSAPHLVWKRGNPGELQRQGYIIHSTADGRFTGSGQGSYQGGSYASTQSGGDSCGAGCEIWCLVEEPGTSMTTTRRVMSAPARITRTPVAPQYTTIRKEVLSDPGGVEEIPVEAEYASVELHDLVRPAEAYEVAVPAEMGTVQTKNLVQPESYEWRRVLCEPGTGTIGSGSSHSSGGYVGSSSGYSSSSVTSGGYSDGYSQVPQYSTQGAYNQTSYGQQGTTYSSGSHLTSSETISEPRTGYYGEDKFPAYRHRAPHRKRR